MPKFENEAEVFEADEAVVNEKDGQDLSIKGKEL